MLPNLIVIGAAKAGTTSLHYYLGLHPQVAMSASKELRFFSHERFWNRGLGWYESQFSGDEPVHGETSPSYAMYPRYSDPPARIHATVPAARLVYVVRDPLERLVSHWVFARSYGGESRSFVDSVRDRESRYVAASQYHLQVSRYLPWFSPSQILVISSQDLRHDLRPTLQRVFRFLDVDDTFWTPRFSLRMNETRYQRRKNRVGRWISGLNKVPLVNRVPVQWRVAAGRYLYTPFSTAIDPPVLDDALRDELVGLLQDDARRFREWTGREFDEWSV